MKNLLIGGLLLTAFPFYHVAAQQVMDRDTIGGTPLTITMDRDIHTMMTRMEENCATTVAKRADRNDDNDYKPSTSTAPAVKVVPNRALTNAEICRTNPRILGYKIQLTVVKSNEEANEVKAYFRRRFPNLKVETDASLRPNYKILAGSYFTKQSAAADLASIKQYFKSATAVQYRVFCVEAK